MPLLNYTTKVGAGVTVAQIQQILAAGGASAVLTEYNAAREIVAVNFRLHTAFGEIAYRLPANVPAVIIALNKQVDAKKLPRRYRNDKEQAERIAWRIVKDWIEAQLAIDQIGCAKLEQVMLSFAVDESGKTFYDRLVTRGNLLLQ
jgi:hypothetical protein